VAYGATSLIAALTSRPLAGLLAVGLLLVFILLSVLIWTRFGQARPVSKCVILSLLAHLLLLIYACFTHVLYGPPGRWTGQIVTVRLRDAADDFEAAPQAAPEPRPWHQAGESEAPELLDAPLASEKPAEAVAATGAAEPQAAAEPSPPREEPKLTDLLPDGPSENKPPVEPIPESPLQPTASDRTPNALASEPPPTPQVALDERFVAATTSSPPRRLGDGQEVPQPLQARVAADRLKAAQPFGATPRTEAAVAAALDWLAAVQSSDGRWDADLHGAGRERRAVLGHDRGSTGANADTGVTGLALLAYLGAGETHLAGKHRETVQHGLEFLLASQAHDGSVAGSAELFAAMYCHGIATLALSEAYALSGDQRLLSGLQRALQFTVNSQSTAGGWRYRPSEPTDPGDMSQFGWQLMALKSAELGGIAMPSVTRARMVRFLQNCSGGRSRGLAAYRPGDRASRTMTAEALVCRYFLEAENSPAALDEAAAYVMEELPHRQGANFYYWYYGTLAVFQRQGEDWRRWNAALQGELLARQRWDGALAGSYDPDDLWGGYGGRVYSTALAALSLEVYYRYLPIHGQTLDDSRLTDRPWQPAMPR
jgi:hypothetical protein